MFSLGGFNLKAREVVWRGREVRAQMEQLEPKSVWDCFSQSEDLRVWSGSIVGGSLQNLKTEAITHTPQNNTTTRERSLIKKADMLSTA